MNAVLRAPRDYHTPGGALATEGGPECIHGRRRDHGADVAAELKIDTNHAYVARWNVQRMIRAVIDRLEGPAGESGAEAGRGPDSDRQRAAPRVPR